MQLMRMVALVLTVLVVGAGYLQESRRLTRLRELPAEQVLAHYERGRARGERIMWIVALALAAAAVGAVLRWWGAGAPR